MGGPNSVICSSPSGRVCTPLCAVRSTTMGFMDKAKKLAEQAQEKLDEAQKNFNQGQSGSQPAEGGVKYDDHGRPVQDETPAAATAPPSATPAAAAPPPEQKPNT